VTQWRLIKVTHYENGTGNRVTKQRFIIHAEGVFVREGRTGDIIHAGGVRFGFSLSAPGRASGWVVAKESAGGLPGSGDTFELVAEILEVVWTDA